MIKGITSVIRISFTLSLISCSGLAAAPSGFLNCYNEMQSPLPAAHFFGVPLTEKDTLGVRAGPIASQFRAPKSETAYIVTPKTILKRKFSYDTAEVLGMEPNPRGGGLVQVSGSPIFEVESKYTGEKAKTFLQARWSSTVDHPNGAALEITEILSNEVSVGSGKAKKAKPELLVSEVALTPEAEAEIVTYLQNYIRSTLFGKRGSAKAYDSCHSILELKEFMESKMNSFDSGSPITKSPPAVDQKPTRR